VSVFDVDPGATAFCAQEFNVKPLNFRNTNRWDYKRVPFECYDVIWLGSVLTHLSRSYSREVLALVSRILKPGGLLIFTVHGDQTFPRLQEGYYGDYLKEFASTIMQELRSWNLETGLNMKLKFLAE
jgi:SAM-dependent methyltransferase